MSKATPSKSASNSIQRRIGGPIDPSLLAPVVKSKRTPIACTECRRRQVKCSGGNPPCERCAKKNIKCEFIPLQKVAPSSPGGAQTTQTSSSTSYPSGHHGSSSTTMHMPRADWQTYTSSQYSASSPHEQYRGMPVAHSYSSMPTGSQHQSQHNAMALTDARGAGYLQDSYAQSYTQAGMPATDNHYGHSLAHSQHLSSMYSQSATSHGTSTTAGYQNLDFQAMLGAQHGSQFVTSAQDSAAFQNQAYQSNDAYFNYFDPAITDASGANDLTGWSNSANMPTRNYQGHN